MSRVYLFINRKRGLLLLDPLTLKHHNIPLPGLAGIVRHVGTPSKTIRLDLIKIYGLNVFALLILTLPTSMKFTILELTLRGGHTCQAAGGP